MSQFWLTAFQGHLEKSITATTNLLIPTTPMPCVLRNVPVAALDHLREGGEGILPLLQPASSPLLKSLCVAWSRQTQDVNRVQRIKPSDGQSGSIVQQNRTMAKWADTPLQLGRLRRPSTRREAGRRGSSSRATGASQKSAGCVGCVHQVCRPQIRSPEGTNASFASVDGG